MICNHRPAVQIVERPSNFLGRNINQFYAEPTTPAPADTGMTYLESAQMLADTGAAEKKSMTLDEFAKLAGDSQRAGYGKERNELLARIAKIDEMYPELASTGDTPQPQDMPPNENIVGFAKLIKEKCEFYWNVDDICNAEIRATLERIHEHARRIEFLATPDAGEEKEK